MVADFIESALNTHNKHRAAHGVPPLTHNQDISNIAQKWADHIARTGQLAHSSPEQRSHNGESCGENIAFWFSSDALKVFGGDMATDQWYDEIKGYDFKKGGFHPHSGHFTQVVWKNSKEFGLGRGRQKDGSWIVVANYYPSGNVMGQFDENVYPLTSGKPPSPPPTVVETTASTAVEEKVEVNTAVADQCLAVHNQYREKHGVPLMKHNKDLSVIAQRYANCLVKEGKFEHSSPDSRKLGGNSAGENLAMFYHGDTCEGDIPTKMWYDEIKDYNFNKQGFAMNTGHFTQVVWKGSTELGVGAAKNKDGAWIFVANYYPAGNMMSAFDKNVFPAKDSQENSSQQPISVAAAVVGENNKQEDDDDEKVTVDMNIVNKCLQAHNEYRAEHGVQKLKHNQKISHMAQKYANYLAKSNKFEHSKSTDRTIGGESQPCGENLAGTSGDPGMESAQMWYNEIKDYDFSKQGFAMGTGHFTQLVWKSSTDLGIGAAKNKDGMWIIVANYYPPGNFKGQFEENVFQLKSGQNATKEKKDVQTAENEEKAGKENETKKSGTCTIL